ncbi:MAG: 50S ribosomal protein L24 [Armatimonadetes bacterium]|nr:50S ribosomal protein L24 [Armatimonadota bacterium]
MAAKKRHLGGEFKPHVRSGDEVLILAGKDVGERGRVAKVMPQWERAIVEGRNIVIRHQKARGGQQVTAEQRAGRISKPAPIHVSNLMVICPSCNQPTRIGHQRQEGKWVRFCKREGCGEIIDRRETT